MIAVVQGDLYRKANRDDEYPKRIIDLKPLKYSVSWFGSASLYSFIYAAHWMEILSFLHAFLVEEFKNIITVILKYLPLADKDDWRRNLLKPFL